MGPTKYGCYERRGQHCSVVEKEKKFCSITFQISPHITRSYWGSPANDPGRRESILVYRTWKNQNFRFLALLVESLIFSIGPCREEERRGSVDPGVIIHQGSYIHLLSVASRLALAFSMHMGYATLWEEKLISATSNTEVRVLVDLDERSGSNMGACLNSYPQLEKIGTRIVDWAAHSVGRDQCGICASKFWTRTHRGCLHRPKGWQCTFLELRGSLRGKRAKSSGYRGWLM